MRIMHHAKSFQDHTIGMYRKKVKRSKSVFLAHWRIGFLKIQRRTCYVYCTQVCFRQYNIYRSTIPEDRKKKKLKTDVGRGKKQRERRTKKKKKVATIYSIRTYTRSGYRRVEGRMNLSSVDLSGRFTVALKSGRIAVNTG